MTATMIYSDVEKVVDFMGHEPRQMYRVTFNAAQLSELAEMAEAASKYHDQNKKDVGKILRFYDIKRAFEAMVRQLQRRDLDSLEGFKLTRPLPVPAMRHASLDCE